MRISKPRTQLTRDVIEVSVRHRVMDSHGQYTSYSHQASFSIRFGVDEGVDIKSIRDAIREYLEKRTDIWLKPSAKGDKEEL